jgi:long-chain fatty acid transport protein
MQVIKGLLGATTALTLGTMAAQAGGIDRSGQPISALFEGGSYFELSFGSISPSISGNDVALQPTGDVAGDYSQFGFAYKRDINDKLSYAIIVDQPFGADVLYGATSPVLGGTKAVAEATAATVLLRYKVSDSFSVHGGLRAQQSSASIDLRGLAYGPLGAYSVQLSDDLGLGYVVGAAYEMPDIALRVAVTYNSAIEHDFSTVETGLPPLNGADVFNGVTTTTNVETPQSVNIDFQSGVAENTLVFGQIRWADWSSFKLRPTGFILVPGQSDGLISLEDTITYTLGVGRRFSDQWSGAFSLSYEDEANPLVSPLAPSNGRFGASLAAVYTMDNMKITSGINYTVLGDANPETGTPDTARASMTGSDAIAFGIKVGYSF